MDPYCGAVDRVDVPPGHSIWHAGAMADYGDFFQGDGRGVIDLICAQQQNLLSPTHQMANILIEVDGDTAASESYITATLRIEKDQQLQQMTVWSRYIDTWSRRNGRWGLEKRIAVRDFDEVRPVTAMSQTSTGRRDSTDPSYTALTL